MKRFGILSLLFSCAAAVAVSAEDPLKHVDVFVSGKDGYVGYRIPAIETAPDGSLLAFAEARKYNLADPGGAPARRGRARTTWPTSSAPATTTA